MATVRRWLRDAVRSPPNNKGAKQMPLSLDLCHVDLTFACKLNWTRAAGPSEVGS
jgi:hypothetical protein